MKEKESVWRRRRRGFHSLAAAVGALGASLVVTSVCPTEWCWAIAGAGFLAFVALTGRTLMLWNVDEIVFARGQMWRTDLSRSTTSTDAPSMAPSRREAWRT